MINLKKLSLVVAAVSATTFAGCANLGTSSGGYVTSPALVDVEATDKTLKHLLQSTRDIQRQWGSAYRLSELSAGNDAPVLELSRVEPSLLRVYEFTGGFEGTLERLVKNIAMTSGYDYLPARGRKPIGGVDVIFGEEMRSLAEYLFDAGKQAGSRADVLLNMKDKTLQLSYSGF